MANDNHNQVLDEHTEVVVEGDKASAKRARKVKPKTSDVGSTASLFGIAPYQPKKMKSTCLKDSSSISDKFCKHGKLN